MSLSDRSPILSRPGLLSVGLIFFIGVAYQAALPTGSDVSWLIVVAERMLDGQRLYVDVIESNPPMAVFLYVPAVVIERLTGISAETAEIGLTTATAAASLALSVAIMLRMGLRASIERFVVFGAFALMVLPRLTFSEREHFALMLMLPIFVLAAARAVRAPIPLGIVIAAGLASGIGAAIKPQYIIAALMPAIYLVVRSRSLKPVLGLEYWLAVGCVAAFAVLVVVAYPAYLTDIVPMEADTYIFIRLPMTELLLDPLLLTCVGVGIASFALRGRGGREALTTVLLLAATGFVLAYIEQGKGWRYQILPALGVVTITAGMEILPALNQLAARGGEPLRALKLMTGSLAMAGLIPLVLMHNYTYAISLPFVSEIKALGPAPRVYALSTDLGVGHPLARAVGGTWVGSTCSQLITRAALFRRALPGTDAATRARMDRWIAWDNDRVAEALKDGRPDVIVYDPQTYNWAGLVSARPDIAAMLDGYTKRDEVDGVALLVRRDLVSGRQSAGLATGVQAR